VTERHHRKVSKMKLQLKEEEAKQAHQAARRVKAETKRLCEEAERLEKALGSKSPPKEMSMRSAAPLWNGTSGYAPAHMVKPS